MKEIMNPVVRLYTKVLKLTGTLEFVLLADFAEFD